MRSWKLSTSSFMRFALNRTIPSRPVRSRHRLDCGSLFFYGPLLTDGEASYESLFPEIFGVPYRPSRKGSRGRFPEVHYRIPRTLAHVQIVKHRQGNRVVQVDIRYAHGSQKCVHHILDRLGYTKPNTSAIERRNGTAPRISAPPGPRPPAFSLSPGTQIAPCPGA